MTKKPKFYDEFHEWITRGPGEPMFGGIVDADAGLKITADDLKPYDKPHA